jgi:hypothetical protein
VLGRTYTVLVERPIVFGLDASPDAWAVVPASLVLKVAEDPDPECREWLEARQDGHVRVTQSERPGAVTVSPALSPNIQLFPGI